MTGQHAFDEQHPATAEDATLPTPPANIAAYVEALGVEDAIRLLLELGGSEIYIPAKSSKTSIAARAIGAENVEKLAGVKGTGYFKVPLGRKWIAEVLIAKGATLNEVARTIRADVATVRRWHLRDQNQLSFF